MRIQHNIMAMSAYRNYTNNVAAMKKNLEKLSSGYKINRAGDDAAGLAISEKMRAQITGLETAQKNAKDGISLVQTAEGALTEVHDMLNRMVELATMSANGTYDDDTDRAQLQKEVDQLTNEINRIADSANFNGIKLLDGSMDGAVKLGEFSAVDSVAAVADGVQAGGAATPGVYSIDLNDLKLKIAGATGDVKVTHKTTGAPTTTYTYKNAAGSATVTSGVSTAVKNTHTHPGAVNTTSTSKPATGVKSLTAGNIDFTVGGQKFKDAAGAEIDIAAAIKDTVGDGSKAGEAIADVLDGSTVEIDGITYDVAGANGKITLTAQTAPTTKAELESTFEVAFTGTGNVEDVNNGWDQSVHVKTAPVMAGDTKLAQGKFELTSDMVQNGSALKIGKKTYIFQVGTDDPITASAGQTVIKLDAGLSEEELVKQAADKLSQQANQQFHITTDRDGKTIHLTEKAGTVNYETEYDLHGTDGDDTDGDWSKVVQTATMTKSTTADGKEGRGLTLQIGDTADGFNKLTVNIQDMHAKSLGIDKDQISIANQDDAAIAIKTIKEAINKVSDVRGTLGATQNRLDHTINNLGVMTENIQDAESTIRDVDVAEEMMAYTKNNILIQSAQAMLAQANQVPQGVLQLLQ